MNEGDIEIGKKQWKKLTTWLELRAQQKVAPAAEVDRFVKSRIAL
jgi:hypothetical protein